MMILFLFSSLHTLQKIPESRFFCALQSQTSENRAMPLVFNVFWFWGVNIIASSSFIYSTPLKQVLTNDLSIPIIWTAFIWFSCAKFLPFDENFHFFLLVTSTHKQQKKMSFLHPFGHCFYLFLRFRFNLHFLHWCLPIPFLICFFSCHSHRRQEVSLPSFEALSDIWNKKSSPWPWYNPIFLKKHQP